MALNMWSSVGGTGGGFQSALTGQKPQYRSADNNQRSPSTNWSGGTTYGSAMPGNAGYYASLPGAGQPVGAQTNNANSEPGGSYLWTDESGQLQQGNMGNGPGFSPEGQQKADAMIMQSQKNGSLADFLNSQIQGTTGINDAGDALQQMLASVQGGSESDRLGMMRDEAGVRLAAALRDPQYAQRAYELQNQQAQTRYDQSHFQNQSDMTSNGAWFSPSRGLNNQWLQQALTQTQGLNQNDLNKQLATLGDQASIARLMQKGYGNMMSQNDLASILKGQISHNNTLGQDLATVTQAQKAFYDQTGGFMP